MAMIRALWDIAYRETVPDFKEEPYDLGSFAEIAHHRGGRGGRAKTFEAGFRIGRAEGRKGGGFSFNAEFAQRGTVPVPVVRKVWAGQSSVQAEQLNGSTKFIVRSGDAEWETEEGLWGGADDTDLVPLVPRMAFVPDEGGKLSEKQMAHIFDLARFHSGRRKNRPFASAPVRSKPRRTYDPARPSRDPEGDYVPMYLAHLFRHQNNKEWKALKGRLEDFGAAAGLFDELSIKSLGHREGQPFQVQVRKLGQHTKGPWRNLIDVGYGISQVLPLVTELLRRDAPSIFLLQQPEVHLHPSAQAALGTLFCQVAKDRQMIVETHSDHLINRIRMDIRDGKGPLSPKQVSILYFERGELEVRIHSLRIDNAGNVLNAPASYGRFFMEETERSLEY